MNTLGWHARCSQEISSFDNGRLTMVFSSYNFLFIFFPLFFLAYYLLDPRYRNLLILLVSLLFYSIGEGERIVILLVSILGNFSFGVLIKRFLHQSKKAALSTLIAGIVFNLGLLGYFKYIGFVGENANRVLHMLGIEHMLPVLHIALPLGISFFAFQGISYLMDIYRGTIQATSSLFVFATYKAMFPQLIAGPIVRYADIADDMADRRVKADDVFEGIGRFVRGLAKKVLIADTMAATADAIFALPHNELSWGVAWLGVIAYTLQIYFDFSGYSDMAIGMGRMTGFKYPENFNHPYTARSIGDFWRRWHMTLSSWFRDYVYFSLGGNRRGAGRTYVNLLIVFALTGLWHGASWTFVIWGLWHGLFMLIERRFNPDTWPIPDALRHVYVMFVVMIGWTLFRADSADVASHMLRAMFGFGEAGTLAWPVAAFANALVVGTLIAGVIFSMPVYEKVKKLVPVSLFVPSSVVIAAVLVFACSLKVLSGSYSPFLYFRF
jgi:alginate O-acetyltransferase complex protein AlgI